MSSPQLPVLSLRRLGQAAAVCVWLLALAACGGSSASPSAPSGTGSGTGTTPPGGSGGSTGSSSGFSIAVDGAAFSTSSVNAVCSTPGPSIVTIVGVSTAGAASTSLGFTALAQPGVQSIAPSQFTQSTMTVISGSTSSGFMAFQTLGRGTITISSISATSVSGSVDLVLVPTSGATTNRVITGTFTVPITGGGAACGPGGTLPGGTTPGGSGGTNTGTGTFTANIDGAGFNGALGLTALHANNQLSISGSDAQYTLQLIVGSVSGPGTFAISSTSATTVALALNGTAQNWFAGPTLGSGSITVTSLTSTAVAGTFSVTVGPSAGGPATGNRVIANGVFNVPLSASSAIPPAIPPGPAAPTGTPTGLVVTVDGTEWRPVGLGQATRTPQGFVTIAGVDLQARGFSMAILASAVGTYSLNNANSHNALYSAGSQQWFTSRPGGGGSVTISSISTTRVTGSFTMTLGPGASNSDQRTLQATGTFDLPF